MGDALLGKVSTDEAGRFSFLVSDDGGKQVGVIAYKDDERFGLYILPGKGALVDEKPAPGEEAVANRRLLLEGMEGFKRIPVGPKEGGLRIVLGGLRVRFRFVDADTGAPALLTRVSMTLRPEGKEGGLPKTVRRTSPTEITYHFDVRAAGMYCPGAEVEGHSAECPPLVEALEEREAVVEVRVRKKE
jgi:hypothetical protein